ncbi:MAG: zf-HC2 domain-containing protein [Fimbriimonadia bacterium]|jgi:hypothetical protein
MDCDSIRPLLADFIEHNVGEDKAEAVRRHVRSCAACGRELDALGRVDEVLQEWRAPALPESVWLNLQPLLPRERRVPSSAPLRLGIAFAAGCAALFVAWAVWVGPEISRTFEGTPAPSPSGLSHFEGTPPVGMPLDSRTAPLLETDNEDTSPHQEEAAEPAAEPGGEAILPHTVEPKPATEAKEPTAPPRDDTLPAPEKP